MNTVRLDKWLWAARFYKTRSKAKQAVEGGKIYLDGVRPKPSREVQPGNQVRIRRGFQEQTVVIRQLSRHRGNATQAQTLYQETPESIARSTRERTERQAFNATQGPPQRGRPTKKVRRELERFADAWQEGHSDTPDNR